MRLLTNSFFVAILLVAMCLGCDSRKTFGIRDELNPVTFEELLALSAEELERVDIGRMNLLCAIDALGGDTNDFERCLARLEQWTEHIKREEARLMPVFERNRARYDNSLAKFKAVNLVLAIKEDFNCRYNKRLADSGAMADLNSPAFFRNPHDVFISGLLLQKRGTCSSYPPLIVALGRRAGYPLCLKATLGHLFCCWDDGKETFNIDTNGEGVDTPSDDFYKRGVFGQVNNYSELQQRGEGFFHPLSNAEALGVFVETSGFSHEANGRLDEAIRRYRMALKYRPGSENLQRLAARRLPGEPLRLPPNPKSSRTSSSCTRR